MGGDVRQPPERVTAGTLKANPIFSVLPRRIPMHVRAATTSRVPGAVVILSPMSLS